MAEKNDELKQDMEEKLMEAKVFLSEARYTNINVDNIKEKIRKAVDSRDNDKFEESIKFSEEAIDLSSTILDLYDKLKRGKKKIIKLKDKGHDFKDLLDRLIEVKDLADEGEYQKADKRLDELIVDIDKRVDKIKRSEDLDDEVIKKILSNIPEKGITVYSLSKKFDKYDKEDLRDILSTLEVRGYLDLEQKGRWENINITDKDYVDIEENEAVEERLKDINSRSEDIEQKYSSQGNASMEIGVTEREKEYLMNIWEDIYLSKVDEDIIEMVGWEERSIFLKDLVFYALRNLKDKPLEPIENKILTDFEFLKTDYGEDILKRDLEEELDKLDR